MTKPKETTLRQVHRVRSTETLERLARSNRTTTAGSIQICNMSMREVYNPRTDFLVPSARANADQALSIPSRINDHLHYRDGRVVPVNSGDQ